MSLAPLLGLLALAVTCATHCRNSTTAAIKLTWTGADYQFECDAVNALLRDDGRYVPKNNIALRAQIFRDHVYLAFPR